MRFGQSDQVFPLGSLGGFGSGSRLANFAQISPTRVQVVSVNWLTTLSAEKYNEVRFGYSRFRTGFNSADATPGNPNFIDPNVLGLDMGTGHVGLPEIDFNGDLENLGATAFSVPRGRVSETFQILDNFTWIRGHHTIKFGGEYHRYDVQSFNDNLERGLLDVNTCVSQPDGSCPALSTTDAIVNELANFYIGNIFASGNSGNTQRFTFNNNFGFFGQDEFRLRPNLTVTAGLRWEYIGPLGEKHNLLSNFDSSNNLVQVGSPTLPNVYNRDLNNFAPRLGISWNPRRNTVVRAGYGFVLRLHAAEQSDRQLHKLGGHRHESGSLAFDRARFSWAHWISTPMRLMEPRQAPCLHRRSFRNPSSLPTAICAHPMCKAGA